MIARAADKMAKRYDKNLFVHWNRHKSRWQISTVDDNGQFYTLFIVETPDHKYREIYECDIARVAELDRARKNKCYDILKYIEEQNEKVDAEKKKKLSETVKTISKDRWRSIFGVPYIQTGCPWK